MYKNVYKYDDAIDAIAGKLTGADMEALRFVFRFLCRMESKP